MPRKQVEQTAIVIGAGMAGLLTARVLADYYGHVTIIERDRLPERPESRRGVPQARHAHVILARGREIIEELFPGLTQHLLDQGAELGGGRHFLGGGYHYPILLGAGRLFASRPLLEHAVRERVLAMTNVQMIEVCDARGLLTTADRRRVIGVHVTHRHEASTEAETFSAGLVVDAAGRGSRTPAWLTALGYPAPQVEEVDVNMGYSTRYYRREPRHLEGDLTAAVGPTPANPRACGMIAEEGERWIVTLAGYFGAQPPTDEQGFLEFARGLPTQDVYDVIRGATPLSEPVTYRFRANKRFHYEALTRFPEGLLVTGDALCSYTPIYGQGMTVAAQEALVLHECLAQGTQQLAPRFFEQVSAVADIAWSIAIGNDLSLTGASPRTPKKRFNSWYMRKLQVAARTSPSVALAFQRVANLIDAPAALLRPSIALRVAWEHVWLTLGRRKRAPRRQPLTQSARL